MASKESPSVVLDVDNTLRNVRGQLMPGTKELLKGLKREGIEVILWTLSEQSDLDEFTRRFPELFGSEMVTAAGDLDGVVRRRVVETKGSPKIAEIARFMERKNLKHPGLFGVAVLVDDDRSYESKANGGRFIWIDPQADCLPDREQQPREWAEEVVRWIKIANASRPDE